MNKSQALNGFLTTKWLDAYRNERDFQEIYELIQYVKELEDIKEKYYYMKKVHYESTEY
jgi:hypothetical protein